MNADEFANMLHDVEVRLDRLKSLYEQWFQGLERLEPTVARKEVDRRIYAMRREQPRNTALRFRFQQLLQRFTTYTTYWTRVARQIEEGTYRRDVMKARRRREELRRQQAAERLSARPYPRKSLLPTEEQTSSQSEAGARLPSAPKSPVFESEPPTAKQPPVPPRPPAGPPPPPAAARAKSRSATASAGRPDADLTDAQIRDIYQRYVAARRRNQQSVENVRYEAVAKSLRQMVPKLQQKHRGKRFDFDIVVKNGRVAIKPIPKK